MYKVNGFFDSPMRRKLRELDFRAPEDWISVASDVEGDEKIKRSRALRDEIDALYVGDGDLQRIINAHRADLASAGVPVYAHEPVPLDVADWIVRPLANASPDERERQLESVLSAVEPNSRPQVARQLKARMTDRRPVRAEPGSDVRSAPSLAPRQGEPMRALSARKAERGPARTTSQLDPDSAEARRIGDELDARDPLAAAAHPLAYGLDTALNDVVGEEGLFGDWGWRRSIPRPSDDTSGDLGDAIRYYLQFGVPAGALLNVLRGARTAAGAARGQRILLASTGNAGKDGAAAMAARARELLAWAVETRGRRGLTSGGISLMAEIAAQYRRGEVSPGGLAVAAATGWLSGRSKLSAVPKYFADVARAVGGSYIADVLDRKQPSTAKAMGAGLGALIVGTRGLRVPEAQVWTQGGAWLAREFSAEYLQGYIADYFDEQIELTAQEVKEIWDAASAHIKRQWEEYWNEGDRDFLF